MTYWSPWSECTATCGGGNKTRTRHISVEAAYGGMSCTKSLEETADCGESPCSGNERTDFRYHWTIEAPGGYFHKLQSLNFLG